MENYELLALWEIAKGEGVKRQEFAERHGITFNQLKSRLEKARASKPNNKTINDVTVHKLDENNIVITDSSNQIKTIDQMVQETQTDLNTWQIKSHKLNKWSTQAVISGIIHVTELFQIELHLVRKKSIPVIPAIQPIEIAFDISDTSKNITPDTDTSISLFDLHFGFKNISGKMIPFHDKHALQIVIEIIRLLQPCTIVIGGDLLDLSEASNKFLVTPENIQTTQIALEKCAMFLANVRHASPGSRIICLEGNHDLRIRSAIAAHHSFAYNLKAIGDQYPALSLPSLLGLAKLGIEWCGNYPNNAIWINDELMICHGDKTSSIPGGTVGKMKMPHSVAIGHIHRTERAIRSVSTKDGYKVVEYICPGCLCRTDFIVPGHNPGQHWSQGFLVVTDIDKSCNFEIVRIQDSQAFFRGKLYSSSSSSSSSGNS